MSWLCTSGAGYVQEHKMLERWRSFFRIKGCSGVAHRDSIVPPWLPSPLRAKSFTMCDTPTTTLRLRRVVHTARKCLLRPGSTWSWLPSFLGDLGYRHVHSRVCDPLQLLPTHSWNLHWLIEGREMATTRGS